MFGTAAERILECRKIMHIHRHDRIGTHRFEQRGDITRGDRIARLCLAVLARIRQIRNDRGDARSGGVLQCADEKQQPAQLVVAALLMIGI